MNQTNAAQAGLRDDEIQALWDEACKDGPTSPGSNRHIRFARALLSKLRAPVARERAPQQPAAGHQYHLLKTDPEVFQAVLSGSKTFEICMNDLGYAVGDARACARRNSPERRCAQAHR